MIAALGFGCTSNQQADIVFNVIEKNPERFMQVVEKAAKQAQMKQRENAEKEEQTRIENEMKNPLTPTITDNHAYRGPKDAPILLVEYSDFECPYCGRGFNTVEEVMKKYDGKIKFVFKHLPLGFHRMAMPAAQRFEAIRLQSMDKAWKFHDTVFRNQEGLKGGEKYLDDVAKKVGADVAKMKKDMDSDAVKAKIKADTEEASKFGIEGTPGFIVAGVALKGAYPAQNFIEIIEKKLK